MPYIVSTSVYPTDKAKEVAERYIEVIAKYPPDENIGIPVVPVAAKTTEQGLRVMTLSEVKAGKLDDALNRSVNAMAMFNEVEGFEYTIDIYMTLSEGLATLGMSMPG